MSLKLSELFRDEAKLFEDLSALHDHVMEQGRVQMQWYYDKKSSQAKRSLSLRFTAITFFIFGGLVPLIKAAAPSVDFSTTPMLNLLSGKMEFGQVGYLLIGIGAGCLAMDRYFGYSTTWIRFVTVALAIEKTLEEYRFEWIRGMATLKGKPPTAEQIDDFVKLCRDVSLKIKVQVEEETKAWVTEFQASLAQLEKDLSNRAATVAKESKETAASNLPGAISVTISNGGEADDGFSVSVDGRVVQPKAFGNKAEIPGVPAGNHSLHIIAMISGQAAYASETVVVEAGTVARPSIELVKVKKAVK